MDGARRLTPAEGTLVVLALLTGLMLSWAVSPPFGPGYAPLAAQVGGYTGGAVLAGAVVMLGAFPLPRIGPQWAARAAWTGWALLAGSTLVATLVQVSAGSDSGLPVQSFRVILLVLILVALVPLLRSAGPAPVDGLVQPGRRRVRRAVVAELILSVLAIGVAAVAFQISPRDAGPTQATAASGIGPGAGRAGVAGTAHHDPNMDMDMDMNMDMSADAGQAYYGISRTPKLIFQVDLVPARSGANTMLLTVLGPGNTPQRVLKWTATASLRTGSARSLPIVVLPMSQGVAYANPQIPVAGDWLLSVTVSTPDQRETTVSQTVKIG